MNAVVRDGADLVLQLHLQPRGGRDQVMGLHGDTLRIRIGAPPVDGAANERLIRFLADAFDVPRSHVVLEQGASARRKRVRVKAPARLPDWLPEAR